MTWGLWSPASSRRIEVSRSADREIDRSERELSTLTAAPSREGDHLTPPPADDRGLEPRTAAADGVAEAAKWVHRESTPWWTHTHHELRQPTSARRLHPAMTVVMPSPITMKPTANHGV